MKESIWKPLSVINLLRLSSLNRQDLSDQDYVVVDDLFLKYKELGPSRLIGFENSQKFIASKDLYIHMGILVVLLFVRSITLFVESGGSFNATKKVGYIKKGLASAWLWYLMIILDQNFESSYIQYFLVWVGIFECMSLFDMFKNTNIPFISNSNEIVQRENGIVRYCNEEHEFIDSFNFFDVITLGWNLCFIGFTLNAILNISSGELYYEEWSVNFSFEICIMTTLLLLKPYDTLRFHSIVALFVPLLIFLTHLKFFINAADYSILELILLMKGKMYMYLGVFIFIIFVKLYVVLVLLGKDKVDDLDFIEDEQRKIIEERRKMISERLKRLEELDVVIIKEAKNNNGGLQGFEGISLFEDLSWYNTLL